MRGVNNNDEGLVGSAMSDGRLDEMVRAMMNEFFSPSFFLGADGGLPVGSSLPPSLRKRLRQKQRPAERGSGYSRREKKEAATAVAWRRMLTMERQEEREGEVVRFTRSVREATVPLIIADRAGAGGGCSPNDRPLPLHPRLLALPFT